MWKANRGRFVGVMGICVAAGCAQHGSREAVRVSRVLLEQTIAYQNQVEGKIKAEEGSYRARVQDLQANAGNAARVGENRVVNRAAQDFQALVSEREVQPRDLRDAMLNLIARIHSERRDLAEARAHAIEAFASSVEALDLHRKALEQVRKNLEQLQTEKTTVQNVRTWAQFGKDVKDTLDKASINAKPPAPTPPAKAENP